MRTESFDYSDPFQRQQAYAHSAETAEIANLIEGSIEQEIENQIYNDELCIKQDLYDAENERDQAHADLDDANEACGAAESERDDAIQAHGADLVRIMCFLEDALAQHDDLEFRKRIMRIRDAVDICIQDDVTFEETISDMLKGARS
jgi:hypothetical protein